MASASDLAAIQSMHESKTVTRDGLIGWSRWYESQLPRLQPEKSEEDLLLTLTAWMELSDKGGQPGFPYEYATDLDFALVDLDSTYQPNLAWVVGVLIIISGLVAVFFRPWLGVGLVIAGVAFHWLLYKARGGATAAAIKDPQVRQRAERALEWVQTHQSQDVSSAATQQDR